MRSRCSRGATVSPSSRSPSPKCPTAEFPNKGSDPFSRKRALTSLIGESGDDAVDALEHGGCELRRHVDRLEVLLHLRDARGARDHRGDARIAKAPRERELRRAAAELLRDVA